MLHIMHNHYDELNADSLEIFRNRLEALRKQNSHTIQDFVDATGISRRAYNSWTCAHKSYGQNIYCSPSIEKALTIARFYNVSLDYLFGLSDFTSPERDFIGKETGLTDETIKKFQYIQDTEAPETVSCINWIINHLFIVDIAKRLIQLTKCGQNDIYVFIDSRTGKLIKVSEQDYYILKNSKNPPSFTQEPLDGHSIGFTSELQEQSALNKITDLFKNMRNIWNRDAKKDRL